MTHQPRLPPLRRLGAAVIVTAIGAGSRDAIVAFAAVMLVAWLLLLKDDDE